jgi:23S rRNA (cytidine1920-2'-O)/16S rRNA (cytidine1409-2'-O)-methyltransferase
MPAMIRLNQALVNLGLVTTRSQADNLIRLGRVKFNNSLITEPTLLVPESQLTKLELDEADQYVSRAAYKLASVASSLKINFKNKVILDVGSSSGGFSDYAIKNGATKVIAVEKGTDQMDARLKYSPFLELHEKTDIRSFNTRDKVDIVLIDVSFVSLRQILPNVKDLVGSEAQILAMVKPQFESHDPGHKHKGVIKNDKLRRQILKDFELWAVAYFKILQKTDSAVSGTKGNQERFYLLQGL